MNLSSKIAELGLLLIPICVFAIAAILSIPLFFRTERPRRGTIEWIRKHDRRSFAPLAWQKLAVPDLLWCLFAVLGGLIVFFVYLFLRRGWHLLDDPLGVLNEAGGYLLYKLIFALILSGSTYLFTKSLFGKAPVALSAAILLPFLQVGYLPAAAMLMLALFFFYRWMTADFLASALSTAVWLILALLFYGLALVLCFPTILLLPLFFAGYVYTQIVRWQKGDRYERAGKLAVSLGLTVVSLLVWALLVWLVYQFVSGQLTDISQLRSFSFFTAIFPTFAEQLVQMFTFPPLTDALVHTDIFLFLGGIAAIVPNAYGIVRYRDSRCILLLLLLLPFGLMWLCGGAYLMSIPFVLLMGWMWNRSIERDHMLLAVLSPAVVLAFAALELLVWALR